MAQSADYKDYFVDCFRDFIDDNIENADCGQAYLDFINNHSADDFSYRLQGDTLLHECAGREKMADLVKGVCEKKLENPFIKNSDGLTPRDEALYNDTKTAIDDYIKSLDPDTRKRFELDAYYIEHIMRRNRYGYSVMLLPIIPVALLAFASVNPMHHILLASLSLTASLCCSGAKMHDLRSISLYSASTALLYLAETVLEEHVLPCKIAAAGLAVVATVYSVYPYCNPEKMVQQHEPTIAT